MTLTVIWRITRLKGLPFSAFYLRGCYVNLISGIMGFSSSFQGSSRRSGDGIPADDKGETVADRDFLLEIKNAEAEAALRVDRAREESQLQRQKSRQTAAELIEEAYEEAGRIREATMEEAQERYRELVAEVSEDSPPAEEHVSEDALARTADIIAERIISILEHR